MPPDSPEPGKFRPESTPYMIPPMAALVSGRYRIICIVCGTQMGKTANLFNAGGEKIDNEPAPFLWIGPTKSNITSVIVPQFRAMLEGCASLREKLAPGRQSTLQKRIAGTTWRFAWAGSPTEIASMPAFLVVVDEVDKCDNIPGHGSVLIQAEARFSNYRAAGGAMIATSSPTGGSADVEIHLETGLEHWGVAKPEDIDSEIWKTWQEGTRHEFMAPCPHCREYFSPRLRYLTGWQPGDSPAKAKRAAGLMHWKCGTIISADNKQWMLENGRAVAPGQRVVDGEVVGEPPDTDNYSIWISGLFSKWVSWGESASQWVRAARKHDPETIRGVINLRFGELFRVRGEAPPWEDIKKISDESLYDLGIVPRRVRMIFITVDVQKDHLVVIVRGWGVESESWLLHREDLYGETDQPEVWARLDQMVDKGIDGRPFDAIACDSGYRTEQVYSWCEKRLGRAYATRGKDAPLKLYSANDVEVLRSGKKVKRGLKVWTFDHGYFKGWVHDRIRIPQDQPGAWHLPRLVGDDYAKQLVAEQRIRTAAGRWIWVKQGVNDFLDAEGLQALLAHIMGVRFLKPEDDGQAPPSKPSRGVRSGGVNL